MIAVLIVNLFPLLEQFAVQTLQHFPRELAASPSILVHLTD